MENAISYEVIRRADGAIALSVNAVQIEFEPTRLRRSGQDLVVEGPRGGVQAVTLPEVPGDVLDFLEKVGSMPLFEFEHSKLCSWHRLSLHKA